MKTVAKVRVTLEIPIRSTWNADAAISQVYKQAVDEARGVLRQHFNLGDGLVAGGESRCEGRIEQPIAILDMVPLAIIVEREK